MRAKPKRAGVRLSIYLPWEVIESMEAEGWRQDRSMSWLTKKAWEIAFPTVAKFPGTEPTVSR